MASTASGIIFDKVPCGNINAVLYKGKTINFSFVWGGSSPIDVTDYDATLTIKNLDGTEYAAGAFNVGNDRVEIGTTDGIIAFSMTDTDSAALTAGNYLYEVEVEDTDGNQMLAMSGNMIIE